MNGTLTRLGEMLALSC